MQMKYKMTVAAAIAALAGVAAATPASAAMAAATARFLFTLILLDSCVPGLHERSSPGRESVETGGLCRQSTTGHTMVTAQGRLVISI